MDIFIIAVIVFAVLVILLLINFVLLFVTFLITPAGVWIKAKIVRKPIICLHYKDSIRTRYVVAKKLLGNFAEVKGIGFIELAKDTANFDSKGKIVWYNAMPENAKTHQLYKAALIQELKELGYKIESWQDLKHMISIVKNKDYVIKEYQRLKALSKEKAEKFKIIVRNILKSTLNLQWNKTYKFSVLYNLFSNDYNPAQVNEAIHLGIMEDRRKRNVNYFVWVILIAILLIVGAIAYTIIKSSQGPTEVVLQIAPSMIKNGTTALVG